MRSLDTKLIVALAGVIVAVLSTDLNDAVTSILLPQISGGLGFSHDAGTWFGSLYTSGEVVGMALSPWFVMTLTLKRWSLVVIGLTCFFSVLIPAASNLTLLYALRIGQGFCEGLAIPLLMTTALRALGPDIRLYGLAAYSLTATFFPNLATAFAGLWTGQGDGALGWQFAFYEALPLAVIAAVPVWWGMPDEPIKWERFPKFDWRGTLLLIVLAFSLVTLLEQGDRYDWFNSETICVLALVAGVSLPLLLLNEWFQEIPLLKLQMLNRPNLAYGVVALFTFLIIALSASTLPSDYLQQVQNLLPAQAYTLTAELACSQLVLLPAMAVLLNFERVDPRVVSYIGIALIVTACVGDSFLLSTWQRGEFYLWQALQSIGDAMVVMPLLQLSTNAVAPPEGPFVSALVNTPRAVGEATGVWLLQLVDRWRGGLHSSRVTDQLGQDRYRSVQGHGVLINDPAPLTASAMPRVPGHGMMPGSLGRFRDMVQDQVTVLTLSDAFLTMAGVALLLMLLLVVLPERTAPPRIALRQH